MACPGAGACGGQFTANTMATVMEFIGLSPAGLNGIPAEDPAKDDAARQSRRARDGPRPARRAAVDVRHARSARERHRQRRGDRRLDQRRAAPPGDRARVRHRPRHRRVRRGRRPDAARRRHAARRPVHGDRHVRRGRRRPGHARAAEATGPARTATHRPSTAGRSRRSPQTRRRADGQQVVVPIETPIKPTGGLAILRGYARPGGLRRQARRPRASAAPRPGPRVRLRGGLLRGGQGAPDRRRRRRRHPLRGPGRRAGDAGDAERHGRARRRGPG